MFYTDHPLLVSTGTIVPSDNIISESNGDNPATPSQVPSAALSFEEDHLLLDY